MSRKFGIAIAIIIIGITASCSLMGKNQHEEADHKMIENMPNVGSTQEVTIGATKESVINKWGEPSKINKAGNTTVAKEQWVYADGKYVYFKNEIVDAIHQ